MLTYAKQFIKKTLNQPYEEHIQRNSSDYVASIFGKCSMLIGSILNPLLLIFKFHVSSNCKYIKHNLVVECYYNFIYKYDFNYFI